MKRASILLILAMLLVGCNRATHSNAAIRQAVIDHLSRAGTGLDVSQMDIDVQNVNYSGDKATATVLFRPKSAPQQGLAVTYNLQSKGNKWQVTGKPEMGSAHAPGGNMPPGHPGLGGQEGMGAGQQALPPGHPSVPNSQPSGGTPK